jgi:hypothetical protein
VSSGPAANRKLFAQLSADASARLEGWPPSRRRAFGELLEDARTSLQREMLGRSLAAGRSLPELHAFADEIRGLDDDALYEACTLSGRSGLEDSVVAQLRAEADPLYAYAANGNPLDPALEEVSSPSRHVPASLLVPPVPLAVVPPRSRPFEGVSAPSRVDRAAARDLGASADDGHASHRGGARSAEELINAAARTGGLKYREHHTRELAPVLAVARGALELGIPIPVALGLGPGDALRYALLLQARPAGSSWAFQLHDPVDDETVWVNEGDLLGGVELPLSNKRLRRITAVVLPDL